MSFLTSYEFAGALACILSGSILGFFAGLYIAKPRRKKSPAPRVLAYQWVSYDRSRLEELPGESIICDRRNRFANGSFADRPVKGAGEVRNA